MRPGRVVVAGVLAKDTCSRCRVPRISSQSKHSRRIVPTHRSAKALARGARKGARTTRAPWAAKAASNAGGNFASRSRSRTVGRMRTSARSHVMLRACWAVHAAVGCAVHPATNTRRDCTCRKKRTYSTSSRTVSTAKKSHATSPAACARRTPARRVPPGAAPGGRGSATGPSGWSWRRRCGRASGVRPGGAGSPSGGSLWPVAGSAPAPPARGAGALDHGVRPKAAHCGAPARDASAAASPGGRGTPATPARQGPAQGGEEHTVAGTPAHPLDLSPEYPVLVPEDEQFDLASPRRRGAGQDHTEEQAEERVGD